MRFSVLEPDQRESLESCPSRTQGAAVVSKRVGQAVIRNRVKRRLREIFRTELPRLRAGLWIVVTAKPPAATASLTSLRSEWLRLGTRLSIFADS